MPRVDSLDLIVGVVSCQKYVERLQACVDTWIPDLLEICPRARVVQVIADENQHPLFDYDRDIGRLSLRCPDTYEALAQKSQLFFKWVLEQNSATHVFKCDDDTLIHARPFAAHEVNSAYEGYPMTTPETRFEYGSGGAGYFIDRRGMRFVVDDESVAQQPFEDLAVGQCLHTNGIALHANYRLVPSLNFWDKQDFVEVSGMKLPNRDFLAKHLTVHLHRMEPEAMYQTHRLLTQP